MEGSGVRGWLENQRHNERAALSPRLKYADGLPRAFLHAHILDRRGHFRALLFILLLLLPAADAQRAAGGAVEDHEEHAAGGAAQAGHGKRAQERESVVNAGADLSHGSQALIGFFKFEIRVVKGFLGSRGHGTHGRGIKIRFRRGEGGPETVQLCFQRRQAFIADRVDSTED